MGRTAEDFTLLNFTRSVAAKTVRHTKARLILINLLIRGFSLPILAWLFHLRHSLPLPTNHCATIILLKARTRLAALTSCASSKVPPFSKLFAVR